MTVKHLAIGGIPAALIVALVATVSKGRIHLTTDEAVFYGGLALGAGTGIAHRIETYGIRGIFTGLWRGRGPTPTPATHIHLQIDGKEAAKAILPHLEKTATKAAAAKPAAAPPAPPSQP